MAKKFEQITTSKEYGSVMADIKDATAEVKEAQKKSERINLYTTPQNAEFIKTVARAKGKTINGFISEILDEYREAHPEYMEAAKMFLDAIEGK